MATATKQPQLQPGELFGFPGITRWTEQPDINDNTTSAFSQAAATPLTGQLPFKQTDIVFGWKYILSFAQTSAFGTDTVQTSVYYPYNLIQAFQLNITNLYNVIDVQSGIDLAVFKFLRPMLGTTTRGNSALMTDPRGFPISPQANAVTFAVAAPPSLNSNTTVNLEFDIPASLWFDEYVELDNNANILGIAHRVPVSPLYMSGTARDVMPQEVFASGAGASTDSSLGVITTVGGGAHFVITGSFTHRWQRVGIYGTTNPAEMPNVFNWRYAWVSKRVAMGGVSQVDIPLKNVINNGGGGQVLMVFVRMFDPAAGVSGSGLPIAVTQLTKLQLLYGSALIRFQDVVAQNQARIIDQHDVLLPGGVIAFDMALDNTGRITNALALNAYTTDITIHLEFSAPTSATAYAVVGVEYLTYVIDQPSIA
jgi:hypothetical protein